ncbi:hypothetical protein [Pseudoalteromonas sp. SW0106-04]|uniref:hypothetical protein n=1 Tax=Pseudoalteromonas sp. SW0106-04 TaxID=1702169 RepID=UPI00359460D5
MTQKIKVYIGTLAGLTVSWVLEVDDGNATKRAWLRYVVDGAVTSLAMSSLSMKNPSALQFFRPSHCCATYLPNVDSCQFLLRYHLK